jgi:hypothetical protein
MANLTTLLVRHRGVDLHAATAWRVLRERVDGASGLLALARAECYMIWSGEETSASVESLLEHERVFNPNKHVHGRCRLESGGEPWYRHESDCRGAKLPPGWPGEVHGTDLPEAGSPLLDRLLRIAPRAGTVTVDVCAFPLGEAGPVLRGILWRLQLVVESAGGSAANGVAPVALAERLAVARRRSEGLLVNPHLECWLLAEARQ